MGAEGREMRDSDGREEGGVGWKEGDAGMKAGKWVEESGGRGMKGWRWRE